MLTTVLIPVYDGAGTIASLVEKLLTTLAETPVEIVLVNDGSTDASHEVCLGLVDRFPGAVSYVRLSKNFGEHNAVMAGLHHSRGDYVVIMDDDFQNPPEEVSALVEEARRGGYDVVYSYYAQKQHALFRNMGSCLHNWMATYLLKKPKNLYLSSFKCVSRFVVEEVTRYVGPFPYLDGLILRCTGNIGRVQVRHDPRRQGRSGYTMRKLIRLWLNMFLNFSVTPLRLSSLLGVAFSVFGVAFAVAVVIEKAMNPDLLLGWPSTVIVIITFSGVQLLMLGLLGEYLGSMFLSQNRTPQFVVRETRGVCTDRTEPHPGNDEAESSESGPRGDG